MGAQGWALVAAALSLFAAVVNLWAARDLWIHRGETSYSEMMARRVPILLLIALLSVFYCFAWSIVGFNKLEMFGLTRQSWSEALTPVSVFSFGTVWVAMATSLLLSTKAVKKAKEGV